MGSMGFKWIASTSYTVQVMFKIRLLHLESIQPLYKIEKASLTLGMWALNGLPLHLFYTVHVMFKIK